LTDIHPERNKKVNNEWRTHCEERNINKVFTDCTGADAHFFAYPGAYAKNIPLNHSAQTVHLLLFLQVKDRSINNSFIEMV
jgi:hypothetical protein